jgi:hypothetical protein
MPSAHHRPDREDDPLEQTELARRLRRMEWPGAPGEVKERVLRRIVAATEQGLPRDGHGADGARDSSED